MGFQLPSDGGSQSANPYLVKPEPKKPPASAYQVKPEPERPSASAYQVKREPDKPRMSSSRPLTPSASKQRSAPVLPSTVSPLHSNRNSPVMPGARSRGLSESSDSNSSSSSDSDSDSDSDSNEKSRNFFKFPMN